MTTRLLGCARHALTSLDSNSHLTLQIPEAISFDQAATLPVAICTSAVSLYHDGVNVHGGTCGLTPPWEEGGRGKYHDQPTVVFGGAGSVGQAGKRHPSMLMK